MIVGGGGWWKGKCDGIGKKKIGKNRGSSQLTG